MHARVIDRDINATLKLLSQFSNVEIDYFKSVKTDKLFEKENIIVSKHSFFKHFLTIIILPFLCIYITL